MDEKKNEQGNYCKQRLGQSIIFNFYIQSLFCSKYFITSIDSGQPIVGWVACFEDISLLGRIVRNFRVRLSTIEVIYTHEEQKSYFQPADRIDNTWLKISGCHLRVQNRNNFFKRTTIC